MDFWKQVFTRRSFGEVILFDPQDLGMTYSVLRVPDSEQGRALVSKERARIAVAYELVDDETRIRSQRGAKEQFSEGLRISGRYITQMQKIFRDEGLPAELAYLPLVESSFNVRARSGAGAVGMWQFIPETGKKFMRIDDKVDERRDPMASTRAAVRLLKENYRILGNWPLAITAYNHGTEGIFRAIDSVGSRDLVELIRRYQSPTFGFASKNFYAEFLAVVEIATQPEKYFPFLRAAPADRLARSPSQKSYRGGRRAQAGGDLSRRLLSMEPGPGNRYESNSGRLPGESAGGKNPTVLASANASSGNTYKVACRCCAKSRGQAWSRATLAKACGEQWLGYKGSRCRFSRCQRPGYHKDQGGCGQ